MNRLAATYRPPLTLLTDLYQVTMAYGYWKLGRQHEQAAFHLYFRNNPFKGGYAIACGLAEAIDLLEQFKFDGDDVDYLATLCGNDGRPLFEAGFLTELGNLRFTCDIDAIPEGTTVFGNEPLLRVTGSILQGQLLETPLLNIINFQTLIATKASRMCLAAAGDPVVEFGLRRAQGIDGSLSASRAAYVGGCAGTSNVLAGKLFNIPVKGTHAHSWVMSFDQEEEAFAAYAAVQPNNSVFLVDTYNTLEGIRRAAKVGRTLAAKGHKMIGIRLDSGDLAYLSIEGRKILDDAGLTDVAIMATNDLDEHIITSLKQQGAKINVWGVGTKLVTAHDQPALGGVYKLGAIRRTENDPWQYKIKLSEVVAKVSTPGICNVRRFKRHGTPVADAIYCETLGIDRQMIIDPSDITRHRAIEPDADYEDLLVPIFRNGRRVYDVPSIHDTRRRATEQVNQLHPTVRRLVYPHEYPVGLDCRLSDLRLKLLAEARGEGLPR